MKRPFWMVLSVFVGVGAVNAAFEDLERGTRAAGLGGAYTAMVDDAAGIFWNPASLRFLAHGEVTTEFARPFGVSELDGFMLAAVQPTVEGSFGIGLTTFGESGYYDETTFSLAAAREWGLDTVFGVRLSTLALDLRPTYGADWATTIDLGVVHRLGETIRLGFATRNLTGPSLGDGAVEPARRARLGVVFEAERGLRMAADVAFDENFPPRLHVGQEFTAHSLLTLRAGLSAGLGATDDAPVRYALGFSTHTWKMRLDYAFVDHPSLGATHRLGLTARIEGGLEPAPARFRVRTKGKSAPPARVVDLNSASGAQLQSLPGIGPALAGRIIDHRRTHGPFVDVEGLLAVKGIGPVTLEKLRPYITASVPPKE